MTFWHHYYFFTFQSVFKSQVNRPRARFIFLRHWLKGYRPGAFLKTEESPLPDRGEGTESGRFSPWEPTSWLAPSIFFRPRKTHLPIDSVGLAEGVQPVPLIRPAAILAVWPEAGPPRGTVERCPAAASGPSSWTYSRVSPSARPRGGPRVLFLGHWRAYIDPFKTGSVSVCVCVSKMCE